jgi:phage baseplate assembly protein V
MAGDELWNAIKRLVAAVVAQQPQPRRGTISSLNPTTMQARVQLYGASGGYLTGWLPLASTCIGPGWGICAAPPLGAQAIVLPTEGDLNSAVVIAAHWDLTEQPPSGYPVGELWFQHATGAFVKVNNSGGVQVVDQKGAIITTDGTGKVIATDQAGATITLPNDGTVRLTDKSGAYLWLNNNGTATLKANLNVLGGITTSAPSGGTGNVSINGNVAATGDVQANAPDGVTLGTHVHGGVQGGSSDTGGPENPIS